MLFTRSRTYLSVCATLGVVLAIIPVAFAGNIYPTNLGQSTNLVDYSQGDTVTLSYLLNDNATGVNVQVVNSSNVVVKNINPGAQLKGSQSVVWDATDDSNATVPVGDYSFRVNTSGAASGAWTLFSTDSVNNNFFVPRGVAVNKNPDSPYYGRIYVTEGQGALTGAGRTTVDGVYMLNADLSTGGISGGTGPHSGAVAWTVSANSPWGIEVGPDDRVYITDFTDGHSGLWDASPNLTSPFNETLDNTGRNPVGLNATHGSITDVIVTGTGASRTIRTVDEDWDAPAPADPTPGSILRYDIGETGTFTGAPSGFAYNDTTNNYVQNFQDSIALANDGTIWLSQLRAGSGTDTLASLIQIDASGNVLWRSVAPSGGLATNSLADPLRGTQGMAYDAVNDLIALVSNRGTGLGLITIFDPVTKTVLTTFNFGGTTNTNAGFDNAGNLYVTNRSAERVRIWGPPNGTVGGRNYAGNSFFTNSLGPLGTILVIPEPTGGLLLVLGMAGLGLARRRFA